MKFTKIAAALAVSGLQWSAQAAPVFYESESAFLAAASGISLTRETFDSPIGAATNSITNLASGLNISANAALEYRYNLFECAGGTTPGNCIWLPNFAGGGSSQTYTFDRGAVNAFGIFLSDLGTAGATTLTLKTSSGATQSYSYTSGTYANEKYFGIVDLTGSFTSVTITNSANYDAVFIDDVRFGLGNVVPEPGSLALVGLSLVGLAASRRRKA